MNKLYSCSWVQNTNLINESYQEKVNLVNESISTILGSVMKKMKAANVGIPYRDARLYFYQFLKDKHENVIPGEFKDKFSRSKPQGKDINDLMGKLIMDEKTPKGFFDKLTQEFDDYSSEKHKIGDKEIDSVTAFLNTTAGSREYRGVKIGGEKKQKYGDVDTIQAAVQSGVAAEKRLKKGATGFETLQLNLSPETEFTFDQETPMGFDLYTTVKDGLKFRVTLKQSNGKPFQLGQLTPDIIKSVVVTEPTTANKQGEKAVVDFPSGGEGDFSGPDPEDTAYGKKEEQEEGDGEGDDDLGEFSELGEIEPDPGEGDESEENSLSAKLNKNTMNNKPSMQNGNTVPDEDCEMIIIRNPSPEHVAALTRAQVDRKLREDYQKRMRNYHETERRHTLGY